MTETILDVTKLISWALRNPASSIPKGAAVSWPVFVFVVRSHRHPIRQASADVRWVMAPRCGLSCRRAPNLSQVQRICHSFCHISWYQTLHTFSVP
jgi:hypothetical protein